MTDIIEKCARAAWEAREDVIVQYIRFRTDYDHRGDFVGKCWEPIAPTVIRTLRDNVTDEIVEVAAWSAYSAFCAMDPIEQERQPDLREFKVQISVWRQVGRASIAAALNAALGEG